MMKSQCLFALSIAFLPVTSFSMNSFYCPQKQGYINIGMTNSQVLELCGQPIGKEDSSEFQITEKVPVTQLIYTTLNQGAIYGYSGLTSYYNMWSLPSGSTGTSLRVSVVDNQVKAVDINGSNTNTMTLCGGATIQVGDDINKVYSACGTPSLVNNTFVTQLIPKNKHPEVWIYQIDQYQPTIHLTFIDGKLQSID